MADWSDAFEEMSSGGMPLCPAAPCTTIQRHPRYYCTTLGVQTACEKNETGHQARAATRRDATRDVPNRRSAKLSIGSPDADADASEKHTGAATD